MLKSKTERIFLVVIILFILVIPAGSYLLSQRLKVAPPATSTTPRTITKVTPSTSPGSSLNDLRKSLGLDQGDATSSGAEDAAPTTFGPILSLKIAIEGRPDGNNQTKLFIGIAEGEVSSNPQYMLMTTVDVPQNGAYSGLSIATLTPNQTYTAYLKGTAQIVKAVTFTMTPNGTTLNNGDPITLTTGDLNDDNIIDQADYSLAKALWGTTPSSSKWNSNVDLNLDSIINNLDLSIIQSNDGKIGDSGKWYSKIDAAASASASLNRPLSIGGEEATPAFIPNTKDKGYWIWVPNVGN